MTTATKKRVYRPTESKYKGGAHEMYVTYDIEQMTRSGRSATYPKIKRIYIAGDVKDWTVGRVRKKSGREVRGVRIEYEQTRGRYHRPAYTAQRGGMQYEVGPAAVGTASQRFAQVVELPDGARNVEFHKEAKSVPARFRHALQKVR